MAAGAENKVREPGRWNRRGSLGEAHLVGAEGAAEGALHLGSGMLLLEKWRAAGHGTGQP